MSAALLAGICCLLFTMLLGALGETRTQRLDDGSRLVLTRAAFGPTNLFTHGNRLEKVLGNIIPSNGVAIARFKLERPTQQSLFASGKPCLTAEFKLVSSNPTTMFPWLGNSTSYPQFRCFVGGETGIEFVEDFWGRRFTKYRDGYFGYISCSRFPRDSQWLSFRIDQQMTPRGPWRTLASFRTKNPSHPANQSWRAETIPAAKTFNGLEFTLGGLVLGNQPFSERDAADRRVIGNHTASLLLRVQTNSVTLRNWSAAHIEVEDASGNWDSLDSSYYRTTGTGRDDWTQYQGWQGLDPRFVWKLEVEFSPASDFAPETQHVFQVPVSLSQPIVTNLAGISLEISLDRLMPGFRLLTLQLLTNRSDVRLFFVAANDDKRQAFDISRVLDIISISSSSKVRRVWGFSVQGTNESVEATIAIVPNVHVTYYVQPKLVPASGQNQTPHAQSP
ncbi:MAG: hypothetical protein ACLQU3_18270 [Limisphaerales bacterium]